MKIKFLNILLFLAIFPSWSFSQIGRDYLYMRIYDDKDDVINFRNGSDCVVFYFKDGSYSEGFYKDTIIANVHLSFELAIKQIDIVYNGERMSVNLVNTPAPDVGLTLYIRKIIFKPGVFKLDCLQTKNQFIEHDLIGTCWDITPSHLEREDLKNKTVIPGEIRKDRNK